MIKGTYNHGKKIVWTPDVIYYNYPCAHHWDWKYTMALFNRKQRISLLSYFFPTPIGQCWGIWQGLTAWLASTSHGGWGGATFSPKSKCAKHYFHDCSCCKWHTSQGLQTCIKVLCTNNLFFEIYFLAIWTLRASLYLHITNLKFWKGKPAHQYIRKPSY